MRRFSATLVCIFSALLLCGAFLAACGSGDDKGDTTTTTDTTTSDMSTTSDTTTTSDVADMTTCPNSDVVIADVDANISCGSGTPFATHCPSSTPAKYASFTFSSLVDGQGVSNLSVKFRNTIDTSALTGQDAREEGYPAGTILLRVWMASNPTTITVHTKAPQIGWTTSSFPVAGEANQLSLFPTYAKELLKCLGDANGLDSCSDKLTQTTEVATVGNQSCTFFTFTGQPGIKICVPNGCEARRTLLPLKVVTTVGGKTTNSTWDGLKPDDTVTDTDFTQN